MKDFLRCECKEDIRLAPDWIRWRDFVNIGVP